MNSQVRRRRLSVGRGVALALAIVPLSLTACGDDEDKKSAKPAAKAAPTPLAITTSDAGAKRFETVAPKSIEGGLVELTFTNSGKGTHEAQLLRIEGAHTAQEALKIVTSEDAATPEWIRAAGGAGSTGPGQTTKTTLNLPAGKYMMFDNDGQGGPSNASLGALAEFTVTAGEAGDLPASTATITAATDEDAEPENSFEITGLKVGMNRLRLVNKGDELHHAIMFPILPGKTIADVKKAFTEEGPSGPPPVDFANGAGTAVLDGDTEQVSDLVLRKPGKYAVVCFLTDRDGKGKQHLAAGMLEEVEVR